MKSDERERIFKMAGLVFLDALLFQEVLAASAKAPTLAQCQQRARPDRPLYLVLQDAWRDILEVDYEPVFERALNTLQALSSSAATEQALRDLLQRATSILASPVLLHHDLMGRVYHGLLLRQIAKTYATFYTSIPAAWLLARLGLGTPNPSWAALPWDDPHRLASSFLAIDFACGSGTLLSALYNAIRERHEDQSLARGGEPDTDALHKALLEEILWGFDVLPYAAHLSATTLALHSPSSSFDHSRVYCLPLGGSQPVRLGSLDFLERDTIPLSYFPSPLPIRMGVTEEREMEITCPRFDVVIMNPPYTRPNFLFGSFEGQRAPMQQGLRRLLRNQQPSLSGIGLAGLSGAFVALANKYLKAGGRMALVLPRPVLSGVAWGKLRELLAENYEVEYILASHEAPNGWNWSENTNLSEVLLVARKLQEGEPPAKALLVNFWRKPQNHLEALVTSSETIQIRDTVQTYDRHDLLENPNSTPVPIRVGGRTVGEAYAVSWDALVDAAEAWGRLMPFAQSELNRVVHTLLSAHSLEIPGEPGSLPLPLTCLTNLAVIGPDRRRVHDAFRKASHSTSYAAFWGHDAAFVDKLSMAPNACLEIKAGKQPKANNYWQRRGALMVAEKLWLNTMRVVAVQLSEAAISNVWWPVCPKAGSLRNGSTGYAEKGAKVHALWLNTTFGLLSWLAFRRDTRGAWVELQQELLYRVPLLDLSQLEAEQVESLVSVFGGIAQMPFPPFPEQYDQAAQGQGLKAQLDRDVMKILTGQELDLRPLYRLLAREPIICLQPLV